MDVTEDIKEKFPLGCLITGTDRSYKRSLYRFAGFEHAPPFYGRRSREEKLPPFGFQVFDGGGNEIDLASLGMKPRPFDESDCVPVRGDVAVRIEFVSYDGWRPPESGGDGPPDVHWVAIDAFTKYYRRATSDEIAAERLPEDQA